jgi:hypothetical protein
MELLANYNVCRTEDFVKKARSYAMKRLKKGVSVAIALIALTSVGIIQATNIAVAQGRGNDKKPGAGPAPHPAARAPKAAMPAPRAVAPPAVRLPAARAVVRPAHPTIVQHTRPSPPALVQRTPERRAVVHSNVQHRAQLHAQVRGTQSKEQQLKERQTQSLSQQHRQAVSRRQIPQRLEKGPQLAAKQGQGGVKHLASIQATDKQRRGVQQRIFSDRHVQRIAHGRLNVPLSVGSRIPRHLHLHRFTPALLALAPVYVGYSYFVAADDTICVVDPETYTIVDVIPTSIQQAGGPARPALTLSEEQRQCIYATVPKDEARTDLHIRLALGAEIPRGVRLFKFPEPALGCSPQLANFRYVVVNKDVLIVDPARHEIEVAIPG